MSNFSIALSCQTTLSLKLGGNISDSTWPQNWIVACVHVCLSKEVPEYFPPLFFPNSTPHTPDQPTSHSQSELILKSLD